MPLLEGFTAKNGETLPWYRKEGQYRGADIETLDGKESCLRLAATDLTGLSILHQQRGYGVCGLSREEVLTLGTVEFTPIRTW